MNSSTSNYVPEHKREEKPPLKANPYTFASLWFWDDAEGKEHGSYPTQMDALYALLRHMNPPWWKRWWGTWKEFWNDNSGRAN